MLNAAIIQAARQAGPGAMIACIGRRPDSPDSGGMPRISTKSREFLTYCPTTPRRTILQPCT
jgi:hypothetical protein